MDWSGDALLSEAEVVRRAHLGDQAAWELVVGQRQEPIFRIAYLMLGDSSEKDTP
jgi:hypothetical protein